MNDHVDGEDDCRIAITRMHLFLDDELGTYESHEVQVHVEHCEGCEDQFDAEEQLRLMIRDCCQATAPSSLLARLMDLHCECADPRGLPGPHQL